MENESLNLGFSGEKMTNENYSFQFVSNSVETQLHRRSNSKDLEDRNIIQRNNIAPNLQAALQALKFKTTANTIEHKLEQRRNRFDLIVSHILIDEVDPNKSAPFPRLASRLSSKLSLRPPRSQLEDWNIVKGSLDIASNLQSISAQLKFRLTALVLNHKIEQRPPIEQLIQYNVIKHNSNHVAPTLQAHQQSIKFQTVANQLYHKLQQRHSLEQLMNSNVFKIQNRVGGKVSESLDRKLGQRPRISDLMSQNILRYKPEVSQNFQAIYQTLNRQKLNFHLSIKLVLRPSKFTLEESNILKQEATPTKPDIVNTLTGFIQQRPSEHELFAKQILREIIV